MIKMSKLLKSHIFIRGRDLNVLNVFVADLNFKFKMMHSFIRETENKGVLQQIGKNYSADIVPDIHGSS